MATILKSVEVNCSAQSIWDAVRDVGNLQHRLAPGLIADCRLNDEGTERTVTFVNGSVLPETIVAIDDQLMRFVWSARDPGLEHHNAAMAVSALSPNRATVSWTADVLPDGAAQFMAPFIEAGLEAMKAHLESELQMPNPATSP